MEVSKSEGSPKNHPKFDHFRIETGDFGVLPSSTRATVWVSLCMAAWLSSRDSGSDLEPRIYHWVTLLTGAFDVGLLDGLLGVAGMMTLLVMTGIIPENSLRLASVSLWFYSIYSKKKVDSPRCVGCSLRQGKH